MDSITSKPLLSGYPKGSVMKTNRVMNEIANATVGGEIKCADLERIIAENLSEFDVPENFDLADELAKDLKYYPRNYELIDIVIDIATQRRKN